MPCGVGTGRRSHRSSSRDRDRRASTAVEEVWGIGGASAAKLAKLEILTAADLAALEPDDARALMTVTGGRTVYELRGISCLPLEMVEPTRKGIAVTRSFGKAVTSWLEMREALASYATRAAEKMRRYKVAADNLFAFMHTSNFDEDPFYSNGASARFTATTNDTGEVVALVVRLGERLWRDGYRYTRCGVMITELLPEGVRQPALWADLDRERRGRVWKTMGKLNAYSVISMVCVCLWRVLLLPKTPFRGMYDELREAQAFHSCCRASFWNEEQADLMAKPTQRRSWGKNNDVALLLCAVEVGAVGAGVIARAFVGHGSLGARFSVWLWLACGLARLRHRRSVQSGKPQGIGVDDCLLFSSFSSLRLWIRFGVSERWQLPRSRGYRQVR